MPAPRKSSIHFAPVDRGKTAHYLRHNDRGDPTKNSIFDQSKNFYSAPADAALALYEKEISRRKREYRRRVGKKLPSHTKLHISAIVNLDEKHTSDDLAKVVDYLEKELGTKVFQYAIHRDEGWRDENGKPHINYHGHIEMLGLDDEGRSVRRKLDRKTLIQIQDEVASILGMPRGVCYAKERKPRPKRLDTYEYKRFIKEKYALQKRLKKIGNYLGKHGITTFTDLEKALSKNESFLSSIVKDIFLVFGETREIKRLRREKEELEAKLVEQQRAFEEERKKYVSELARLARQSFGREREGKGSELKEKISKMKERRELEKEGESLRRSDKSIEKSVFGTAPDAKSIDR